MSSSSSLLRWGSLVLLVFQNCSAVLLMRYTQSPKRIPFSIPVANLAVEVVKFLICSALIVLGFDTDNNNTNNHNNNQNSSSKNDIDHSSKEKLQEDNDSSNSTSTPPQNKREGLVLLKEAIFHRQSLQMAVPATLFTIQNNLLFVALANLDATSFQVSYQLKLLFTAVLMVFMLGKELKLIKWFSLFLLFCGIVLTQLKPEVKSPSVDKTSSSSSSYYNPDYVAGLFAVIICASCSAFASVYFEKILKTSSASASSSIAVRNVQLAMYSFGLNFLVWVVSSGNGNASKSNEVKSPSTSILSGFDTLVWILVLVQAAGGLLVAVVIKYCDNILKTFATSIAIIVNGVVSYLWLDFSPSFMFLVGAFIVMVSTSLYSLY